MQYLRSALEAHRRLKERVHSTRVPLSKTGQRVMSVVYFCIPLVVGKLLYDYVREVQERNWSVDPVTGKRHVPEAVARREDEVQRNAERARLAFQAMMDKRNGPLP